ncbi:unnamed protein product [Caenorhabditis angaria]|uniref:Uncharacterized protein n=1 Tax=Caenorhabditis angaria TaxID=860376 RepID=A0A9P1IYW8_9PELO|nr:unnamed protein product [Caenorhabditis angaria]
MFFFLKFYNRRLQKLLKTGKLTVSNSLTARYQIEENIKFLNIATTVVICIAILSTSFLFLRFAEFLRLIDQRTIHIFLKIICLLNPLFLIPAVLSSISEWRYPFLQLFFPFMKKARKTTGKVNTIATGVLYFQQLDASWQ